ncbi:MAG: 3-methylcrotonyl-CoA carboxylase subunit alpha, partial [Pseudomonadota bacterium]
GTVEFIVEGEHFYFMEMNTRLQVEHPVTEMITDQDLVEWQLRVASGERLPLLQDELRAHGHSIEVRIYAEDPQHDFLPATGVISQLSWPLHSAFNTIMPTRVDSGIQNGDEITPYYDPMIAKLIVHGEDRNAAIAHLQAALADTEVVGLTHNLSFLSALLKCPDFVHAKPLDTGLIARNLSTLLSSTDAPSADAPSVAALIATAHAQYQRTAPKHDSNPWHNYDGFSVMGPSPLHYRFGTHEISLCFVPQGIEAVVNGQSYCAQIINANTIRVNDVQSTVSVTCLGQMFYVQEGNVRHTLAYHDPLKFDLLAEAHTGCLRAPMPGAITALRVALGEAVKAGQVLMVMEAMKMEHSITAPSDGTVEAIYFNEGEQVKANAELIKLQ